MKLNEYLGTVKAARILGVSKTTLINWEKSGKLVPLRHPINGSRMYKREDLEAILDKLVIKESGIE